MFKKELTLIKQVNQKNVCLVIIGILKDVGYKFQPYLCNGCHAMSMMTYGLKNIAILNAKMLIVGVFYGVLVKMMRLIG